MKKVADGEKQGKLGKKEKKEQRKQKIMTFIVATNVVASRPPKRRPTGTPHARANFVFHSPQKTLHNKVSLHTSWFGTACVSFPTFISTKFS